MKANMTDSKVTLKDIYDSIEAFRTEVRDTYVTKDEFNPVKAVTYGMVSLILTAVLLVLVATVVKAF